MMKWFSGDTGECLNSAPPAATSSSLLSNWNSYAAARASEESSSSGSFVGVFDIESAVRSANDTVSGTFNVVSKGVRDIPGNFQSATSNIPSGKALLYFSLLLATGVFFVFIAFALFLPVIVLVPQKFSISFTLGSGFIIGSFFALRGPMNQFDHMISKEVQSHLFILHMYSGLILLILSFYCLPEASFHISVHWQHGGDDLRLYGVTQLCFISALLCYSGSCTSILCHLLLSWWINWDEVPDINFDIFNFQVLW